MIEEIETEKPTKTLSVKAIDSKVASTNCSNPGMLRFSPLIQRLE